MSHRQATDKYGFRYRGGENTRIEAFTDAAFAFAVTLLMIGGGRVPGNVAQLIGMLPQVPGYAASFALLCLFWHAHYTWYRRYGIEDGRSVLLSLLLVFLVLIYVYPLRMMFDTSFVIGPAQQAGVAVRSGADWRTIYQVFGIAYTSMAAVFIAFYAHALGRREELALSVRETALTRLGVWRWVMQCAVGILSALLATYFIRSDSPSPLDALPGFAYWLIAIGNTLLRRNFNRRMARIGATA